MRYIALVIPCMSAALLLSSCGERRQVEEPAGAVHPSVARFIGDELSRNVPDALVLTAADALALLFSDRAASYSSWPEGIEGRPPQAPFTEFEVDGPGFYSAPSDWVRVSVSELEAAKRTFNVYWNVTTNKCEYITINPFVEKK